MAEHIRYFSLRASILLIVFSLAKTTGHGCVDTPNWSDSGQDTCTAYAEREWCRPDGSPGVGWVPFWGPLSRYADVNGLDATDACCACGKSGCKDIAGWRDTDGDDCHEYVSKGYCTAAREYGRGWSSDWGRFEDFAKDGIDATEACCGCGRGGLVMDSPICGTNNIFEYSFDQRCQAAMFCKADDGPCSTSHGGQGFNTFKLDACMGSSSDGYHVGVAYASSSSANASGLSGQSCLIIDGGQFMVVLTVPHRAGNNTNCNMYCDEQCSKCHHFDLTNFGGQKLLPGNSTAFSIGNGASSYNLTYDIDVGCGSIDHYTITGPSVKSIAIPSFEGDGQCSLGSALAAYPSPSPLTGRCNTLASQPGGESCHNTPVPNPTPSPKASQSPPPVPKSRVPSRSPSRSRSPSQRPSRSPSNSPISPTTPSRSPVPYVPNPSDSVSPVPIPITTSIESSGPEVGSSSSSVPMGSGVLPSYPINSDSGDEPFFSSLSPAASSSFPSPSPPSDIITVGQLQCPSIEIDNSKQGSYSGASLSPTSNTIEIECKEGYSGGGTLRCTPLGWEKPLPVCSPDAVVAIDTNGGTSNRRLKSINEDSERGAFKMQWASFTIMIPVVVVVVVVVGIAVFCHVAEEEVSRETHLNTEPLV